ncbi:MAG: IS481 family transposase [Tabrizicola sp.]|nr:IS481 family transposase [Tabrizicola sp.]
MGQVLHGSATTTEAVRRAIQYSQESLRTLAKRYGVNQKTVAKWRKREGVADLPTGPKEPKSTVLTVEDEAIIVAFRRHTLLPLDDCLYSLQSTIPHLSRSSLHRCLQRHAISRLPDVTGDMSPKKKFKSYPIGYFHIDIAEVQTAEGKLHLFVAIDRTSKFAFVRLEEKANRITASAFLVALIKAVPFKVHTVLTDRAIGTPLVRETMARGIQFTFPPRYADGPTAAFITHMFDMRCRENGIEHRLTKIKHPWTNGQVERMNRTIKDATVKRFHYDDHAQLRRHLADFIDAYNFGRRLKTLRGLTPYEFIVKCWTSEPERFTLDPTHQMPGLNT